MNNQDYATSFLVEKSPEAVFNAINNVRGWWSGKTDSINDEFTYQYGDVHRSVQKISELVPGKKSCGM